MPKTENSAAVIDDSGIIPIDLGQEEFYRKCSEILEVKHEYAKPTNFHRSRWNNRAPGNGRFPGFGTIQCFGSGIRIMQKGKGTKILNDYEEVYYYLNEQQAQKQKEAT